MFKKIQQYLLEHHPLLWNMRLHQILAISLCLHFIHFVIGYLSFSDILSMGYSDAAQMFFSGSFALFSIVGSGIVLVLWLVKVFRNNALKRFYPISKAKVFVQCLILFLVCSLNMTYYYSYTYGFVVHGQLKTDIVANEQDQKTYTAVEAFFQESRSAYDLDNRCYPSPFPMTRKYINADSSQVTVAEGAETIPVNTDTNGLYYLGIDGKNYSVQDRDSMSGHTEFSYLNYCCAEKSYDDETCDTGVSLTNAHLATATTQATLQNHPEQIKANMIAFLKLCDKYNIKYKLNVDDWYKWVYNPPYFPVQYTIQNVYYNPVAKYDNYTAAVDENGSSFNPKQYFVQRNKLEYILDNTYNIHHYHISIGVFCFLLYWSLSISLLIFAFRASSKRTWIISLIAGALFCLLVGAFSALFAYGDNASLFIIYELLILTFLLVALVSKRKTIAGVALNWFTWSAPAIIPLIIAFCSAIERQKLMLMDAALYHKPSFLEWIDDHSGIFFTCNLGLYLIGLYALSGLYRRWQAMPED
jgi:hypothetical protein